MKNPVLDRLVRYLVATLGLFFVAVGVALSIKSDLGTAPVSCPPYVVNLWNGRFTVGAYTMMMHLVFILLQVALLRRAFKLRYLMQVVAAVVFGLLTDLAIGMFAWVSVTTYAGQLGLTVLAVVVTALGVSLEVLPGAWMLAGEQTVWALSEVTGVRFGRMKVFFDVALVALSAAFAYAVFGNLAGNGTEYVIREGTLIFALCTGLCMRWTDPLVRRVFGGLFR